LLNKNKNIYYIFKWKYFKYVKVPPTPGIIICSRPLARPLAASIPGGGSIRGRSNPTAGQSPTGKKCLNQQFKKWGLKTKQKISQDAFVIEYVGELIDKALKHN
jgi:hypothetical protein